MRNPGGEVATLPEATVLGPLWLAKAMPTRHHNNPMTTATWITMLGILTFIWGGFLLALRTAVRKESEKAGD